MRNQYRYMIVGYGFTKMGMDALKRNRAILSGRKAMRENPYAASAARKGERLDHFEELQAWKAKKDKREQKIRRLIYACLLTGIVLLTLFFLL